MDRLCKKTVLIFFLLFPGMISTSPFLAAADHPEKSIAFAESLFAEGDYFRAITEYKRILFFSPDDNMAAVCRFRIGESYYRAKRWDEAVEAFDQFMIKHPNDLLAPKARYMKGMAEKERKRFGAAAEIFKALMADKSSGYADQAAYQLAMAYIEDEDWQKARDVLNGIPAGSAIRDKSQKMSSGLKELENLPQKSPETAGLLAALLPGAGHLYAERPKDAAVAFLLNASFIAAAVELFRKDNNILGGIVAFIEAGWYLGNVYSAVNSAHKYNKRKRDDFLRRLKEETSLSFRYNPQADAVNLALHLRF